MPRLICTALRFEGYNRGDLIDERHTERFLGSYPHQVVELTDEDLAAYEKARQDGTVSQWIEAMCAKPTVQEAREKAQKPEPRKPLEANARKPKAMSEKKKTDSSPAPAKSTDPKESDD